MTVNDAPIAQAKTVQATNNQLESMEDWLATFRADLARLSNSDSPNTAEHCRSS
jgi:hypothetical protein